MENKKDLSKEFAIIFGIKPEEVPSKSSGNVNYFKELRIIKNDNLSKSIRNKKDAEEFMKQLESIKEKEKQEKETKEQNEKQHLTDIFDDLLSQEKSNWLSRDQTRILKDVGDSTYEKALNDKESIVKDAGKFYRDEDKMQELYDKIQQSVKEKEAEFDKKVSNIFSDNTEKTRLDNLNSIKNGMIQSDPELNSLSKDFLLRPTKEKSRKLDNALSDNGFPLEEWKYLNLEQQELKQNSNTKSSTVESVQIDRDKAILNFNEKQKANYIKEWEKDEKKYPNIAKLWLKREGKTMSESLGEFLNEPNLNNKLAITVEGIKQQLEKYSNMENSNKALEEDSKLGQKESEKLEIMRDLVEGVGLLSVNSQDKGYRDLKSSDKDQANDYDYVVTFKDERLLPLGITYNMFESLSMHYARNNYNSTSTLLFASDKDTGEMICLDGFSILSITKIK